MEKVLHVTYASSLTNLCSFNSSFDSGVLRIAYHGENRNKSYISKDVFEKCVKTAFGCPVVCNYDRDTDTLGGHDMEIVRDKDGGLRLVNMTNPVGFIPESSKYWWDTVEEDDGTTHEYLYIEALLWKRQEAYRKIKKDGITAHSMEITVKDGQMIDGVFHINDFEFTAFALIGVMPCFESSALELYSKQDFKKQLSEMMQDWKESFSASETFSADAENNTPKNNSTEGGKKVLQDKTELAAKYGIDVESLDFSLDDFTEDELVEKFEAMSAAAGEPEPAAEPAADPEADQNGEPDNGENAEPGQDNFALTSNIVEAIQMSLDNETVEREWGTCARYCFVDCDFEASEVYCWDTEDWLLYGFAYSMNGDNAVIDFESKKRKKYAIVDFDEGEQASPIAQVFSLMEQKILDGAQWEEKYQTASDTIATMEKELGELRQFKADTESADAQAARDEVFSKFDDLVGVEAFENLRENCAEYDVETLEEKCYAIRGRNGSVAKFSLEEKTPKLKVNKTDISNEPYGGIFAEYGIEN